MALNLRDALYKTTTDTCWICMIEGRMMVGRGSRTKGQVAWARKCDLAQVFKLSDYWLTYLRMHRADYPDITDREWDWDYPVAQKAKKKIYKELLKSGQVKYFEVKPE
jgi:hypothetical protein